MLLKAENMQNLPYKKFVSRLDEIKIWGETIGISSEDLSHVSIEDLKMISMGQFLL